MLHNLCLSSLWVGPFCYHTQFYHYVFEPRYVQLIRHISNGHKLFAIPRLKGPSLCTEEKELQQEHPPIHNIAGIAKIMQIQNYHKIGLIFGLWVSQPCI